METFTKFKPLVVDSHFKDRKWRCLDHFNAKDLDAPITGLIDSLCRLPFCFTLQSCFGHFVITGQQDPHNLEPLPPTRKNESVEYRIAYIAFCVEHSLMGKEFLGQLKQIPDTGPGYIQFGSAKWFWKKYPNSYVLQVEPARHMQKDKCVVDLQEALSIEKIRNQFYDNLMRLVSKINKT